MKLFIRFFFLFVSAILFFSFISHTTYAISGCFCDGSSSCYSDGCTRKTIKADGSIDYGLCGSAGCGGAYNCCYDTNGVDVTKYFCTKQPPCCAEMVARNDPEACCWPERGYCHPFYCSKVSRPEKCGWYWSFHGEWSGRELGYGCTKGTSDADLKPVYGLPPDVPGASQPTSPPQPTKAPTVRPTQYIPPTNIPITIPTQYSSPPTTYIPPSQNIPSPDISIVSPTIPNATKTSFSLPSLTLPSINMEPLKINMRNTIIQSEKVLNIPAEAVSKIAQIDNSLEVMINRFIENIIRKLRSS